MFPLVSLIWFRNISGYKFTDENFIHVLIDTFSCRHLILK